MPLYVVDRRFSRAAPLPTFADDLEGFVNRNREAGVTWLHSYVVDDLQAMLCVYEAPSPEAIRRAARRNDLPVDRIRCVSVLNPHTRDNQGVTAA
jgi:hypothetical protein